MIKGIKLKAILVSTMRKAERMGYLDSVPKESWIFSEKDQMYGAKK